MEREGCIFNFLPAGYWSFLVQPNNMTVELYIGSVNTALKLCHICYVANITKSLYYYQFCILNLLSQSLIGRYWYQSINIKLLHSISNIHFSVMTNCLIINQYESCGMVLRYVWSQLGQRFIFFFQKHVYNKPIPFNNSPPLLKRFLDVVLSPLQGLCVWYILWEICTSKSRAITFTKCNISDAM